MLGIALAGGFGFIWLLVQGLYRLNRGRVSRSARTVAAALGLSRRTASDPRMEIYEGASMGCRLYVATHAEASIGPLGAAFQFQRNPVVVIAVLFPAALPGGLAATTVHMAPRTMRTGDAAFDQWFKLTADEPEVAARLLEPREIRDALMRLYGEGRDPNGSGILVDIDALSLVVRYHEPRPARAGEVGRASLAAALKLGQRAAFL